MPIFDFFCSNCQETFEELVPLHTVESTSCHSCGSAEKVSKVVGAPKLFKLIGDGFYKPSQKDEKGQ